ncbi:long-chain fatty acid--CoA ligase [Aquabacterium sp.]|uniref:AMP-dependent synthetase/ligase n=1 Tax=Aquabacterium sp. TaxID=1872578 RepID=UPI002E31CC82|nr:long-chain fatty acid--CoA ligase [Aquabacterium sp.]HEX5311946.1 long-chain fatty acid--CoA ligase [Aquabacterium sp.]
MSSLPLNLTDVHTLAELLAWRAQASPNGEAYRQFDAAQAQWRSWTWQQAQADVRRWAQALSTWQLERGARVAILLPNGIEAVCIDQACLSLACVPVPLHAIDNPASVAYILADSAVSLLVVQTVSQWQAIASVGTALPALQAVVVTDNVVPQSAGDVPVWGLQDWLARGESVVPGAMPAGPNADDLAAIVYTSGTTGKPKGVMLTHGNVLSNVKAVLAQIAPTPSDVFLSFLPLSHTFERTAGYYLPIAAGSCVVYARSVALLAEDLKSVRPTVLISVPRIYERVHARIQETLAASPFKARVFAWAQTVGWRRFCRQQGLPVEASPWAALDGLLWPVLRGLAAQPLLDQFGGRLRVAVSGGAPLAPSLARCFLGLGMPLLQGYGMTETSPIVAVNLLHDNDPATVGRPLPGVLVRIGENRELQVQGPSVMKGYLNRPEDTAKVLSADGWLGTGDQAAIENGRVRILGRIKEIIVTSTGEKVPPGDLELALAADPLFAQAFVVGEQRPFIAAVVVMNPAEWRRLAGNLGLNPDAPDSLAAPAAREAALARIKKAAAGFPHYAVPRAVCLTLEPWTIENTMMTPTLKLKRNNLMNKFASDIEAMYRR